MNGNELRDLAERHGAEVRRKVESGEIKPENGVYLRVGLEGLFPDQVEHTLIALHPLEFKGDVDELYARRRHAANISGQILAACLLLADRPAYAFKLNGVNPDITVHELAPLAVVSVEIVVAGALRTKV